MKGWKLVLALWLLASIGCQPANLDYVYDGNNEFNRLVEGRMNERLAAQSKDGGCIVVITGAKLEELFEAGRLPGCVDAGPKATVVISVTRESRGERDIEIDVPWQIYDTWRPDLDTAQLRWAAWEEIRYGHSSAAAWMMLNGALDHPEPLPALVTSEQRPVRTFVVETGPFVGGLIALFLLILGIAMRHAKGFGGSGPGSLFGHDSASIHLPTGGSEGGADDRARDYGEE